MTLKESCVSVQANHDIVQSAVSNKSSPRREILHDPLSRAPLQAAVSAKDRCRLCEA